jgi:hypothetical protein
MVRCGVGPVAAGRGGDNCRPVAVEALTDQGFLVAGQSMPELRLDLVTLALRAGGACSALAVLNRDSVRRCRPSWFCLSVPSAYGHSSGRTS